jgi:ADP-ribose pyrophosphatase YjhB (NUDIX family)
LFTKAETAELIRLLKKVAENGYRWPTEECMRSAHRVVSFWAPELVIMREPKEVLLAIYDGGIEEFRGMWQLPGGYNRWDEPDVQATCSRVALREIGVDVKFVRVLDAYKWQNEHPYGRPLSIYCLCEPVGTVKESEKLKFFPPNNLPERLVEPHGRFIKERLRNLF